MSQPDKSPFFVGYLPVPKELRLFLLITCFAAIALGSAFGMWIGATQNDPGPAAFRFDYGRQTVIGVIERTPVPILHVTEGNERIPTGHTLMMSGPGKNGVMDRNAAKHGQLVQVSGVMLERGALDMMQIRGGRGGMRAAEGSAEIPASEDLGRWRLAGEICDGKCLAGAMRPGTGLSHKACANLCIAGGVPPVFVSTQPVAGSEYLLIAGPGETGLNEAILRHSAQYVSVEGRVRRHGDLLVFAMEPDTIEVLK